MTTRGSFVISEEQVVHTVNTLPFRVVFRVYACRTSPVLRTLVAPSLAVSSRSLLLHHASEGDSEYVEPYPVLALIVLVLSFQLLFPSCGRCINTFHTTATPQLPISRTRIVTMGAVRLFPTLSRVNHSGRTVYGRTGRGRTVYGRTGCGRTGCGRTGCGRTGRGRTGCGRTGCGRTVCGRTGCGRTVCGRTVCGRTVLF
jgi:hypothetical protein